MAPLPRQTLRELASAKIADAALLFEHGRYSNSYYLYGYGIELGLKACIARQISAETIPDKAILNRVLTHKLEDLVALAGLRKLLDDRRKEAVFDARWAVVEQWSAEARYELIDAVKAAAMKDAIEHKQHGAMSWLMQHW